MTSYFRLQFLSTCSCENLKENSKLIDCLICVTLKLLAIWRSWSKLKIAWSKILRNYLPKLIAVNLTFVKQILMLHNLSSLLFLIFWLCISLALIQYKEYNLYQYQLHLQKFPFTVLPGVCEHKSLSLFPMVHLNLPSGCLSHGPLHFWPWVAVIVLHFWPKTNKQFYDNW